MSQEDERMKSSGSKCSRRVEVEKNSTITLPCPKNESASIGTSGSCTSRTELARGSSASLRHRRISLHWPGGDSSTAMTRCKYGESNTWVAKTMFTGFSCSGANMFWGKQLPLMSDVLFFLRHLKCLSCLWQNHFNRPCSSAFAPLITNLTHTLFWRHLNCLSCHGQNHFNGPCSLAFAPLISHILCFDVTSTAWAAVGKTISMALALQHLHGHGGIPKSDSFWLLKHPAAHVQSHGKDLAARCSSNPSRPCV